MENEQAKISPSDKLLASNNMSAPAPAGSAFADKVYNPELGKVEINIVTPKYNCLTKEELQRYADDPFWKRLRLSLFILLWGVWLAMFVAAIVLVVISPKCPAKPTRHWWQKQVSYQVWTRSFQDSDSDGVGDLKGIIRRIPDVLRLGVQSLWLVPLLKSGSFGGYDVTNFTQIEPRIGTMADFDDLVKKIHEKGMFLIMDYPLTTTSIKHPWFGGSASREPPYINYYVWRKDAPSTPSDMWALNGVRKEHYMHYPNKTDWPILNWSDASLRSAMFSVLRFWLDRGVDGFYLGFVNYMVMDAEGNTNWDQVHDHLKEISGVVQSFKNATGEKEILLFTSLSGKDDVEQLKASLVSEGSLKYVLNTELTTVDAQCNARCVYGHLDKIKNFHEQYNETWPMWELGHPYISRIASRAGGPERSELLVFMLMMLPGSINAYYGDEIGLQDIELPSDSEKLSKNTLFRTAMLWDDTNNGGFSDVKKVSVPIGNLSLPHFSAQYKEMYSPLQTFKRMTNRRMRDDAFLFGTFEMGPADDDVLVIVRKSKTNTANYVAVFNFGSTELEVNLADKKYGIEADVFNVAWMTSNLGHRKAYEWREEITPDKLKLGANEAILLRFN